MKTQYLNTVTCALKTDRGIEEVKRSLIRTKKLTLRGAERILRNMYIEDEQCGISPDSQAIHIEVAQFGR